MTLVEHPDSEATPARGLPFRGHFCPRGTDPYEAVNWHRVDVEIKDADTGTVVYSQRGVEAPTGWSKRAVTVVASKYFHGDADLGGDPVQGGRESSVRQLVGRVCNAISLWGREDGFFDGDDSTRRFHDELVTLCLGQYASFNSPVWFNVGLAESYGLKGSASNWIWGGTEAMPCPDAYRWPQASACQPYHSLVSTTRGLIPIGRIVDENMVGLRVYDGVESTTRIVAVKSNGRKPVFRIRLNDGFEVEATGDHLVCAHKSRRTPRYEWVSVSDLKPGMMMRVHPAGQGVHDHPGCDDLEVSEAALAGWLQTDGFVGQYDGTNKSLTVEFVTVNADELSWVIRHLDAVFPGVHRHLTKVDVEDPRLDFTRVRLYGEVLRQFVETYDLLRRNPDMEVPWRISSGTDEVVVAYLRSVFQADGYVSINSVDDGEPNAAIVGMSKCSRGMMRGVQRLLARLGIYSRMACKPERRSDRYDQWLVTVGMLSEREKFAARVGFVGSEKQAKLQASLDIDGKSCPPLRYQTIVAVDPIGERDVYDIQTESGRYLSEFVLVHNCFIQSVADDMASIMRLATSEAMLFKYGSGTGTDLSTLRSTREKLSGGGRPSGPVSFMRIYDSIASVIKSGGVTRRAAKMQTLRCDHPDIMEFVDSKAKEDAKARAMIESGVAKPGMTGDYDEAYSSVFFQNCNMSVRVSDAFLEAAEAGDDWATREVTTGRVSTTFAASTLVDRISENTWKCGDPGMQYSDTINRWHTCPNTAPINSSNPCARRGSRLLTDHGWVPVEELAGIGPVAVFDGVGFVPGEVWHTGRKPVVRLHANSGETIDLTPDHRVYTTAGWIAAGECEGQTIPRILPNIVSTGETTLPRAVTGASGRFYNHAAIDLMEALGFIQGDGSFRDGCATIHHTPEKDGVFVTEAVLPILQDIAADKGELDYVAGTSNDGKSHVISRKKLTDWLKALGFVFVPLPERNLPSVVWSAKRNAQAAFLRGLFGANGNILKGVRQAVVLVSTCRRMLQEVQMILRTMGIMSSVRRHSKPQEIEWDNGTYVSRESFHLEITHRQDIASFARIVGFPQEVQQARLKMIVGDERISPKDGGSSKRASMEIVRVEDLGVEDDVYDFRSPTTSMGLCEGILIHNCSEFVFIDDSACNLASINLKRFVRPDGRFDEVGFRQAVRIMIVAQEILVDRASYPTREIAENSHRFRPLGLGYANLGALLMARGLPYNSEAGRDLAAAITSIMNGQAYLTSSEVAGVLGPFDGYAANAEPMLGVIGRHWDAARDLERDATDAETTRLARLGAFMHERARKYGERRGYRNSQVTLLAPTGTIAFMMDCDTTGIEPATGLVTYKALSGGGQIKIVNRTVPEALEALGYGEACRLGNPADLNPPPPDTASNRILAHLARNDTVEGAPDLKHQHLAVFDCAFPPGLGGRSIPPTGHIEMMAAVQPFLSGAISKTCNVPAETTPEEILDLYLAGWKLGIKALAIYRDGSKGVQPITTSDPNKDAAPAAPFRPPVPAGPAPVAPGRERLPDTRSALTHHFIVEGHDGYITVGLYPDGRPGEVFVTMAKEGSTIGGLMDALGTSVSIGLQYGVPLEVYVAKLAYSRFEPWGFTPNPDIPTARSLADYVFRWLGMEFIPGYRENHAPHRPTPSSAIDEITRVERRNGRMPAPAPPRGLFDVAALHNPRCRVCHGQTIRVGTCYTCTVCGEPTGCG